MVASSAELAILAFLREVVLAKCSAMLIMRTPDRFCADCEGSDLLWLAAYLNVSLGLGGMIVLIKIENDDHDCNYRYRYEYSHNND